MISSFDSFVSEAEVAIDLVNQFARKHKLTGKVGIDHICYKCNSSATFERIRKILIPHCVFCYQSEVAGRQIAYLKLKEGLNTAFGEVFFVELADKKPEKPQVAGFHHVEIFPGGLTYKDLVAQLKEKGEVVERDDRPHHPTDDVIITPTFLIRLTTGTLLTKIKREEMK